MIGEGKRADLVLAHRKGNHIHIDHVWRQGKGCSDDGKTDLVNGSVRLRERQPAGGTPPAGTNQLLVAHRYITRDASAGSENHIALSEREFYPRGAKSVGLELAC